MDIKIDKIKKIIKEHNLGRYLFYGNFGIEKENIRVDKDGKLVNKDFPITFGNKLHNPYLTNDFAESQIEMITPVLDSLEDSLSFLENIHDIVDEEFGDDYLWPQSTPPILPDESEIEIAKYDNSPNGLKARKYREQLAKSYGKKKQMISGIHYNFSFKDEFLTLLYKYYDEEISYNDFKNKIYLKISRGFLKYRWLILYLMGSNPVTHCSYGKPCVEKEIYNNEEFFGFNKGISFRNGLCGYKNKREFFVNYDRLDSYIQSLDKIINSGAIQNEKEYYSSIRIKSNNGTLDNLKTVGISYLEVRILDLNPLNKLGIDINSLYLMQSFLMGLFLMDDNHIYSKKEKSIADDNHYLVANFGRKKDLLINDYNGKKISINDYSLKIVNSCKDLINDLTNNNQSKDALEYSLKLISNPKLLPSQIIFDMVLDKGFVNYSIDLAKKYSDSSYKNRFLLKGHEDMELSTQILLKESIKRGIRIDIIDHIENFITLENNGKKEYIKQATKTSLDSYITFLMMENKVVSKHLLKEKRITVPLGKSYDDFNMALEDFELFKNKSIVIKPKSTNFGIGITIFKESYSYDDYKLALNRAFKHDKTVLVENFVMGKEYRFLVIGDEVVGILHRVPANVTGDGIKTIRELVNLKNKNPLRGKGYKTPLEKISLGEAEKLFLKSQNLDFDYIPKKNETIYLRENSNISTGGDSIDFTDDISDEFKKIAVKSAKAAGAVICGVDMMIEDISNNPENNYSIIEINFNPAIHIHTFPFVGKNRKPAEKILKLLKLI